MTSARRSALILAAVAVTLLAPATAAPAQVASHTQRSFAPRSANDVLTATQARAARRSIARTAVSAGTYTTPDGRYRIPVEVSPSYDPRDRARWQRLVNLLASLDHGFELGLLKVFVGRPGPEIWGPCQDSVNRPQGCYAPELNKLIIPGEPQPDGFPAEPTIAHEYGHHILNHRSNSPWLTSDHGAKRWATQKRICHRIRSGALRPGDDEAGYEDTPEEGFAEGYAWGQGHRAGQEWSFDRILFPDAPSLAAIRGDVLRRWTRNRTKRFRGRLSAGRRSRTFRLRRPLDGAVRVRLAGPRGSNFDIRLIKGGKRVKSTRRRGSRDGLRYRWCSAPGRLQTIVVKVVRRSGSGRFRLRVSWPGR